MYVFRQGDSTYVFMENWRKSSFNYRQTPALLHWTMNVFYYLFPILQNFSWLFYPLTFFLVSFFSLTTNISVSRRNLKV